MDPCKSYSPIIRAQEIEKEVTGPQGRRRKYYRSWSTTERKTNYKFRATNYYGGSACADVVGCNINCVYCWVKDEFKDANAGEFLGPQDVVDELLKIANAKDLGVIRLSGGEPTLSRRHLLEILNILKQSHFDKTGKKFILETNGILIGDDSSYSEDLKKYRDFLHVRVSLKGATPEKFAQYTGASSDFFELQKRALFNCLKNGIDCHPVIMFDLIDTGDELAHLTESLRDIGSDQRLDKKIELDARLEFERLFLYPYVVERFNERGIPYERGNGF